MALPKGGRRPGAGRPKGTKNRKRVEIAQAAATAGITPIEVMLGNMRDAHFKYAKILNKIIRVSGDSGQQEVAIKAFEELQKVGATAHAYARDAAPYIHPRLTAVAPMSRDDLKQVQEDNAGPTKPREVEADRLADLSQRFSGGLRVIEGSKIIDATPGKANGHANGSKPNGTNGSGNGHAH